MLKYLVYFFLAVVGADVVNCDIKSKIKLIHFSISSIKRNTNVKLNITTRSPLDITDAVATYSTQYNYLPIFRYKENLDLINRGINKQSLFYPIPSYALGNIVVIIEWSSVMHGDLLCIRLEENL